MIKINIKRIKADSILPQKQTPGSAGFDLFACLDNPVEIKPFEKALIPTGLVIEIPNGFEGQVRPRSGLAIKHGITVLNAPGTIDSDYRGELCIILINLSNDIFIIENKMRIAQIVFNEIPTMIINEVDVIKMTGRGQNGFGSTGI